VSPPGAVLGSSRAERVGGTRPGQSAPVR